MTIKGVRLDTTMKAIGTFKNSAEFRAWEKTAKRWTQEVADTKDWRVTDKKNRKLLADCTGVKVVGNVFDNPELITDKSL